MMRIDNTELVTARDLGRQSWKLIARLQNDADTEKLVITKHGKMVAVLLTVEEYERLRGEGPS